MIMFEFAALIALVTLLTLGSLIASIHRAVPLAKRLSIELAACPEKLEMRYTIIETVARWNDGTVVALRPRQSRPVPQPAARAAA
jgi:hypothetical protein